MAGGQDFGAFFRLGRKALGLSLREFCRRNGFNAANISRLERGLAPPPRTDRALGPYVKALKLNDADRQRFLDLAAIAAGRLPEDLLENPQKIRRLPRAFQGLRPGGRRMGWVRALDLEHWAETCDARSRLPELVRRLVRATGKDLRWAEFPAGEQVQRPGWDGRAFAGGDDIHVPAGDSVWELSVEKDVRAKVEQDFVKRTKNPPGVDPAQTTFVFVTPRKWQGKEAWREEKEKSGPWKEVRAYDSATLEEWLERAPAVDAWLAELLQLEPNGVTSLDEYWANLQALTHPSLSAEVFLASRGKQVEELESWLSGAAPTLAIAAGSPGEAIDFLAAFAQDAARWDRFFPRTLIVESRDAWRALATQSESGLFLVPHPSLAIDGEMIAEAERKGHRVLYPLAPSTSNRDGVLKLSRVRRHDLVAALKASGPDEGKERAQRAADKFGGSLTVLKRLLARNREAKQPKWAESPEAIALVPFLLAGSWNEGPEADQAAIEEISGKSYADLAGTITCWAEARDPFLRRDGFRSRLVSRDDSWFLLGRFVTNADLVRFERVSLKVLAADDPMLGLSPMERWRAAPRLEGPRYSKELRQGLAETLALLGASPERLPNASIVHDLAGSTVRELLHGRDARRWASLSDVLPLLAEAAPDEFLSAVEHDILRPQSALVGLFPRESHTLFITRPDLGLLWALELLAWGPRFLARASLVLAFLDEKAPGARSGNCPFRSLLTIFMPWLPQTTASAEERAKVLRTLARRRPVAAWRLLIGLLSSLGQISTRTYQPAWRDWALSWSENVSRADYWHTIEACSSLLVEQLGVDISRYVELIQEIENLFPGALDKFIEKLDRLAEIGLDAKDRRTLSDALRERAAFNRKFHRGPSEDALTRLEQARRRLDLNGPVEENAWLFKPFWDVFRRFTESRIASDETDRKAQEAEVHEHRHEALREIIDQRGWPGVLELVETADAPGEVGQSLAGLDHPFESTILPDLLTSTDEKVAWFAREFARGRFHKSGWDWVERLSTEDWSVEHVGWVLVLLPFERRTWELAAAKGDEVAAWYWKKAQPCSPKVQDADDANYAVERLLAHEGMEAVFHVIFMAKHHVQSALIMDALECLLNSVGGAKQHDDTHGSRYVIPMVFQELEDRFKAENSDVDGHRLARLEWGFLQLLDGHPASPVALHGLLSSDADLFVEILGLAFRPKDVNKDDLPEPSEEERLRALNGFHLLRSWKIVPGSQAGGTVDEKTLFDWVHRARELARERGLLEVCDSQIGEVLAHAPGEADGSWPCEPVRDALEEIETDEILSGFSGGIFNKRGAVWKSFGEGGAQERELAKTYRGFAGISRFEWPRTARALDNIAETYESQARREDATAEQV